MTQIIFVHGMNATAESWGSIPNDLSVLGQKISVVPLPGHEQVMFEVKDFNQTNALRLITKGRYPGSTYMETYLAAIESYFQPGTDKNIVLIGHSMGGAVISHVAARFPERVKSLVYIAAMLPDDGESISDILTEIQSVYFRNVINNFLSSINTSNPIDDFIRDYSNAPPNLPLVKQPKKPLSIPFERADSFKKIPWSYVFCKQDNVIPADVQRAMVAEYSRVQPPKVVEELSCGHLPQFDLPQKLVEAIRKCLM